MVLPLLLPSPRLGLLLVGLLATSIMPALATDYRSIVQADSPSAYWRLGETSGATVQDTAGSHIGTAYAVVFGRPGAIANDNDTALGFDGSSSFIQVPYSPELNTPAFSLECWAKPTLEKRFEVIDSRGSSQGFDLYAFGVTSTWSFSMKDSGWAFLHSGRVVTDQWTHLVAAYDGSNMCLYVNGVLSATLAGTNYHPNLSAPITFGTATSNGNSSTAFIGDLDEVAVYDHALSANRVVLHYGAGKYGSHFAPVVVQEPLPQTVTVGSPAALAACAYGDPEPALQWYKDGVPLAGATRSTFALSSASYSDNGVYSVAVENGLGTTNSQPVKLAVMPPPFFCELTNSLVLHLKFDGDFLDSSGRTNHGTPVGAPGLVAGRIGSGALHYNTDVTAGVYNYVTLGTPADLQFGASVNFSVGYWVRFTGTPGDLPFLCNSVGSFSRPGFTFAPSYDEGGWSWSLALEGGNGSTGFGDYGEPASINDGQWHHLLHSFDREGDAVTYLDGVRGRSMCIVVPMTRSLTRTTPVNIGQDTTGHYPESGEIDIDDLGVWRRALSPYEAECVYSVGKNYGLSFDSYGPVALRIQTSPGGVEIIWQAGVLESADDIHGLWEPVADAIAPYCRVSENRLARFYRVRL
jgi:hypothetical protein